MKRRWKQTAGFTLVELIVVIAILGILAGVAVPTYSGYVKKANEANDNQLLMAVNTAFTSAGIAHGIDVKDSAQVNAGNANLVIDSSSKKLNYNDSELIDDDVKASFKAYFGEDSVFKYFDQLYFVKGAFIGKNTGAMGDAAKSGWSGSNFGKGDDKGQSVAKNFLETFDTINDWLGGDGALAYLLADTPKSLADALGFTDMANVGVENFASDAAGRSAQEVLDGATSLLTLLSKAYGDTAATDAELVQYYKQTLTGEELNDFLNDSAEAQVLAAKNGLALDFGDLHLSGVEVGKIMANAGDTKNSAGISGLGGMYALAAGFYNSSYYKAETMGAKPSNYGEFSAVMSAASCDGTGEAFQKYMTEGQGLKDMEAYVSFMGYLSTGNIEGTYAEDGLAYMAEVLGFNK